MLNLTLPAQVKTLADQPTTNDTSTSNNRTNEPENDEFSNVLAREVSEKKVESERKNDADKASTTEESPTSAASSSEKTTHSEKTTVSESSNHAVPSENSPHTVPPNAATNTHTAGIASSLLVSNHNHETQHTIPSIIDTANPGVEAPPPFALTALSAHIQNKQPTDELGQIKGNTHLASNPFLLQNSTQNPLLNNNVWQPLEAADFAVSGKNLSFYAETNKTILASAGESTLSSLTDPTSTQQPGLNSFSTTLSTTAATQDISLATQVGQPKWNDDFAQKIVWLSNQQNQVAEIRLNPAHLGPVEVTLNMTSEQATAQFASPHAAVREAIEAALPRLREMMAENGIDLGSVTVGTDSFQQQEQSNQHAQSSSDNGQNMMSNGNESTDPIEVRLSPSKHQGLVNTFA